MKRTVSKSTGSLFHTSLLLLGISLASTTALAGGHRHHDHDSNTDSDAAIDEFAITVRTLDAPEVPPDLSLCAAQSFTANLILGATVWSTKTDPTSGEVYDDTHKQVGTGTACFRLTDFTFPIGSRFPVAARFVLPSGTFTGVGECVVTGNDKPEQGVILAACSAKVTEGPKGFLGGFATTTTVINVFKLPGYTTGSYLTIRGYRKSTLPS